MVRERAQPGGLVGRAGLHLRPLSHRRQRVWRVGAGAPDPRALTQDDLVLETCPGNHDAFASLRTIFGGLEHRLRDAFEAERREVERLLAAAVGDGDPRSRRPHARMLADSVAFAILRRISRESVYTAPLVDRAAAVLNHACAASRASRVHVPHVDALDRPTLKVLARAALLLEPADRFAWVWHSEADPRRDVEPSDSLFSASRQSLLATMLGVVDPELEGTPRASGFVSDHDGVRTMDDVTLALVVQNYDACFLWTEALLRSSDAAARVDAARLQALAAVNVGRADVALSLLGPAEDESDEPPIRAHLAYLQGLIEAKRVYRLDASDSHYARGMGMLATHADDQAGDLALEEAWLLNGMALNASIRGRRDGDAAASYSAAFDLVRRAFSLVREESTPGRIYLRSNLIANSALLLEMSGRAKEAVRVLEEAFDRAPEDVTQDTGRLLLNLAHRIGTLQLKAGDFANARRLFQKVEDGPAALESWPLRERVLRAIGFASLLLGDVPASRDAFRRGLELSRKGRSLEGTTEHARGLVAAFAGEGAVAAARDVVDSLVAEEGIDVTIRPDGSRMEIEEVEPSIPSPKLPAYLPEIDLEGVPKIDLNRYLVDAETSPARAAAWTGHS